MTFKDKLYTYIFKVLLLSTKMNTNRKIILLDKLTNFIYKLDKKHRHIAKINLDLAFKDNITEEQKEEIIKATYKNLIYSLYDYVSCYKLKEQEIMTKITFKNKEYFDKLVKENKKIIMFSGHYGNWEILLLALGIIYDKETLAVARPLDSKTMEDLIKSSRERFGIKILSKTGAIKGLINGLKNNSNLLMLNDQNISLTNGGIECRMFGEDISQVSSVSMISRTQDAIILPVFITRNITDPFSYVIEFKEPFKCDKTENKDMDIFECTQKQVQVLEKQIKEKPEEWFWLHKRFKTFHSELYKKKK